MLFFKSVLSKDPTFKFKTGLILFGFRFTLITIGNLFASCVHADLYGPDILNQLSRSGSPQQDRVHLIISQTPCCTNFREKD